MVPSAATHLAHSPFNFNFNFNFNVNVNFRLAT